ncbi:MAG: M56 family metallopeptidase [Oscillospiraceae bacterium]|nr:M56 family metallopeptidase [Oscillospiraceae bacterium]
MDSIFLTVLNMSLTGAFVIAVICIARLPLKKAPKIISYCLWAVAGIRLAFPISIESTLSLIPFRTAPIQESLARPILPIWPEHLTQAMLNTYRGATAIADASGSTLPTATYIFGIGSIHMWISVGAFVWLIGFALMLTYGFVSCFRLKNKMKLATLIENGVYATDKTQSPFVLGVLKPKIYIPHDLSAQERTYIILHERTHIRRCDYIFKFAAYFVLCLHWFNPIVWAAFLLMGADMEMSCDERVLKEMGDAVKKDYSLSLLSFTVNRRIIGGSPLAFSEGGLKNRIKNVLNFKKTSKIVVSVAITLAIALSVGLLLDGVSEAEYSSSPLPVEGYDHTEPSAVAGTENLQSYQESATASVTEIEEPETFADSVYYSDIEEASTVYGRIHTTTPVFSTSASTYSIPIESNGSDSDCLPIYQGAVVEIIGPWDNERVKVLVTPEGGHNAHNGWQTWQLWIDSAALYIIER